jgi:hypothetical protein
MPLFECDSGLRSGSLIWLAQRFDLIRSLSDIANVPLNVWTVAWN